VTPSFSASSAPEKPRGEDREESAATFEGAQEATGGRTADGVDDEIDVTRDILGRSLGVVDEFVCAEGAHERLVLARRHRDHSRVILELQGQDAEKPLMCSPPVS
jgi:hypothetical protein